MHIYFKFLWLFQICFLIIFIQIRIQKAVLHVIKMLP